MSDGHVSGAPRPTGGPGVTRFAARGGHRLSYESSGAGDGRPILGLHDLLADRGQLRALAGALAGDDFRLTLPDMRGHGASPMISGRAYPTAELVADALAVLDAEGLERVCVVAVGWSAGIALGMAVSAPKRVSSLLLADPFLPAIIGDAEVQETLRRAADDAERGEIDRALDRYLGLRADAGWRDTMTKAQLGTMRRAAGNLSPLLMWADAATLHESGSASLQIPVTVLTPAAPPAHASRTVTMLTDWFSGAQIERFDAGADSGPSERGWLIAVSRALGVQSGT